MKVVRAMAGVAGLLAVILAIPVFVTGTGLLWWTADGVAELPTVAVRTDARAFVAGDIATVWSETEFRVPRVSHATLTVDGDEPLFVGIGPAGQVERFVATGLNPHQADFWAYSSDGTATEIGWDLEPGSWSAVVMNADGSPGVEADVRATLPTSPIRLAGGILAGVGLVIGAVGSLMLTAAWGGGRRGTTAAGAPATA